MTCHKASKIGARFLLKNLRSRMNGCTSYLVSSQRILDWSKTWGMRWLVTWVEDGARWWGSKGSSASVQQPHQKMTRGCLWKRKGCWRPLAFVVPFLQNRWNLYLQHFEEFEQAFWGASLPKKPARSVKFNCLRSQTWTALISPL